MVQLVDRLGHGTGNIDELVDIFSHMKVGQCGTDARRQRRRDDPHGPGPALVGVALQGDYQRRNSAEEYDRGLVNQIDGGPVPDVLLHDVDVAHFLTDVAVEIDGPIFRRMSLTNLSRGSDDGKRNKPGADM